MFIFFELDFERITIRLFILNVVRVQYLTSCSCPGRLRACHQELCLNHLAMHCCLWMPVSFQTSYVEECSFYAWVLPLSTRSLDHLQQQHDQCDQYYFDKVKEFLASMGYTTFTPVIRHLTHVTWMSDFC